MGNGVADDKAVYSYVPAMIRYYLNEEPILPNVPTYQLHEPEQHVFENINKMVIKKTNQSGGYGMLMGHKQNRKKWKISATGKKIRAILSRSRSSVFPPLPVSLKVVLNPAMLTFGHLPCADRMALILCRAD